MKIGALIHKLAQFDIDLDVKVAVKSGDETIQVDIGSIDVDDETLDIVISPDEV